MFHCWFDELPMALNEVCCPERLPPTLAPLITMPGVCSIITHGSRALGIFSSMSLVKLADIVVDVVSTTGLSPVTVTVSCTVEISSPALTSALKPAWTMMSLRTYFLKPVSSELTM